GFNHYTIVVRADFGEQTVRVGIRGPDAGGYPVPAQVPDAIWEVIIAKVRINSAGAIICQNNRRIYNPSSHVTVPVCVARQGSLPTSWSAPGTTEYNISNKAKMQVGVTRWTGSATHGTKVITFPIPYDYNPIVIFTVQYPFGANNLISTYVNALSPSAVTAGWNETELATLTDVRIAWMAIGPLPQG
ncbi:unnamed protein product, partial [marine sediment metagenome]